MQGVGIVTGAGVVGHPDADEPRLGDDLVMDRVGAALSRFARAASTASGWSFGMPAGIRSGGSSPDASSTTIRICGNRLPAGSSAQMVADGAVRPGAYGGFDLDLPASYSPSRHAANSPRSRHRWWAGSGWFVDADPRALTASLVLGEPPTFPAVILYPLDQLGTGDPGTLRIGRALPAPGQDTGPEVFIDWTAQSFALLAGMPGSGMTNLLNAAVAGSLAAGAELGVVPAQSGAADERLERGHLEPRVLLREFRRQLPAVCRPGTTGQSHLETVCGCPVARLPVTLVIATCRVA